MTNNICATDRLQDDIASTPGDKNMTPKQYNKNKHSIRKHLCNKCDDNAVLVQPGSFLPDFALRALKVRLGELNNGQDKAGISSIVRGYRLISMLGSNCNIDSVMYSAVADVLIKLPCGHYESLTKNTTTSRPNAPHIFVVSSRMHPELSDADLLTGYFLLCTVIGGPAKITATLLRLRENTCEFEKRRMCASPEDAKARRSLAVRQFPGYAKWAKSKSTLPPSTYIDAVISFGMPSRELGDVEMDQIYDGTYTQSMKQIELGTWSEYVMPYEPWRFEYSRWLPSVHRLHCLIDENPGAEDELFHTLYAILEEEYAERLTDAEERCKQEHILFNAQEFR